LPYKAVQTVGVVSWFSVITRGDKGLIFQIARVCRLYGAAV